MLVHLSIRNLAVIESVQLSFSHGFQVLTGETGAGKSIVIDALTLIAGGRGSSEWVRYGCDKAEIEAMFEIVRHHPVWAVLERLGILASADESLVIRRDLTIQGKSTSRINGHLVNLTMLREVGEWLVNIHGQHEHQSLLKAEEHLGWLDAFGGQAIEALRNQYQASYDRYVELTKQLTNLEETSKQALQMRDLYLFQVEEIEEAHLKPNEDELLEEEKRKLSYAEKLFQNSSEAYEGLHSNKNGLDAINKSIQRLQEIAALDPGRLKPLLEQVQSAFYQLEDAAFQLRDYRDQIEFNPKRIDQIEQRLHLIASFRRKYGVNVIEILQYLHKIKSELQLIENKDELLLQIQSDAEAEYKVAVSLAITLSKQRQLSAAILSAEIERELRDLQMERTRFSVRIERFEDKLTRNGCDQVEFLISANPGEPLRPMSKIASGGELSRIMLAMKSIFAKVDQIPVLVFDEVDTGVSGRAAQAIAEKLSVLSKDCQVFSITHLPQVACMADSHYLIQKAVEGDRTFTQVEDLDVEGQLNELARMLGGVEITDTTLEHAGDMLRMANEKKKVMHNV
ncbi:MAG: DNA repair protein RecN [Paenibacillaceae bacterium]